MSGLCICTPLRGPVEAADVNVRYAIALAALARDPAVEVMPHLEFIGMDLVRARSRAVRMAMEGGFDHLLFWDADVSGSPEQISTCIRKMIASGKDLVGAMYRRKDSSGAMAFSEATGNVLLPMGFTLISKRCMDKMVEKYSTPDMCYFDDGIGTCALFQTMIRDGHLLSEDYSFCQRWVDMGEKCHLYYGTVLDHAGGHVYR